MLVTITLWLLEKLSVVVITLWLLERLSVVGITLWLLQKLSVVVITLWLLERLSVVVITLWLLERLYVVAITLWLMERLSVVAITLWLLERLSLKKRNTYIILFELFWDKNMFKLSEVNQDSLTFSSSKCSSSIRIFFNLVGPKLKINLYISSWSFPVSILSSPVLPSSIKTDS